MTILRALGRSLVLVTNKSATRTILRQQKFVTYTNKVFASAVTSSNPDVVQTNCSPKLTAGDAVKSDFPIGTKLAGFKVTEVKDFPDLHLTAVRLHHQATNADYLHIARDDPNNVFCIGFRTTPMDSTGVPHILEHTVLCGSEKYPCRDPFFKMLNRSLATFMNAMTGNDYTMYPFSTQHPVDFQNLMSVYLDAVFKPNLSEIDFLQEGWRLEYSDLNDKLSKIVFKGVVFNEMKGVFADPGNIFSEKLQNCILPSHTYGVISGGDPVNIPDLTWEHLKDFHSFHYHPSNCRLFTYGDQPLANHLKFINDNYLRHFSKIDPKTEVPDEPNWTESRRDHVNCGINPMSPPEAQTSLAISYKLGKNTNVFECFISYVLNELLISGPNAPFYKSLIEPQFGSSFSPATGYSAHTRDSLFSIGLQGMKNEDIEKVINIISETFDSIIDEGFPQERIEAILHSIELSLKHQSSSFGLTLAMSMLPVWNQNGDPILNLEYNKTITNFRKCLNENPKFLQEKVKVYFKENPHKFILTMSPVEGYEETLVEAEEKRLQSRVENLTEVDKEKIWDLGKLLAAKQEIVEDISCLPTLTTADIPRDLNETELSHFKLCGGVPLQLCSQPTNGVIYLKAIINIQDVPKELQPLIPILATVLTSMGAGKYDYRELDEKMELKTGGLNAQLHLIGHPVDCFSYEQGINLSSHCLSKNLQEMLDLWTMIINEVRFDDLDRFTTLIKMTAASKSESIAQMGHAYAMRTAASSLNPVSLLNEQWTGLSHLVYLNTLSQSSGLDDILSQLQRLASILLGKQHLRIAVNATPDQSDEVLKQIESFLSKVNGDPSSSQSNFINASKDFTPQTCQTHHVFPFPINFASKSYSCQSYVHPDTGAIQLLSRLMFKFLHREIREKGGAYGGGAAIVPGESFNFYSYRDPNSTKTLSTFDAAIDWILDSKFTEQDVSEAKLGVFQKLDSPISPGNKGLKQFFYHISDEMFANHRRSVLGVESQDLIRVAQKYLKDAPTLGACLLGPQNDTLKEDKTWSIVNH